MTAPPGFVRAAFLFSGWNMAKTTASDPIKARVLTSCRFGNANDVVTLDVPTAQAAQDEGLVDTAPEAVAYAESIVQPAVSGD
jgi:hypothetical protein